MNAYSSKAAKLAAPSAHVASDVYERIDGEFFPPLRENELHLRVRAKLTRVFNRALDETHLVVPCGLMRLAEDVEVRPDLHIQPAAKKSEEVRGADIALAVEICYGSAMLDYERKVPHYARNGVRELWVLDLDTDRAVVFRKPTQHGYFSCVELPPNAALTAEAFPAVSTSLAGLV